MASLNHVCIWSEHGWKRITAQEANQLHSGGTVSARSGLFMCELCGQYVTLTDGIHRDRYFKHSAYETSKDCPERTFGSGAYIPTYRAEDFDLPIRLSDISTNGFQLELGFLAVPPDVLHASEDSFLLVLANNNAVKLQYSLERLNEGCLTYLPIGNIPAPNYTIECPPAFHAYWPQQISGINPDGSIFDGTTRKKLPTDADVQVNKAYYLLTCRQVSNRYETLEIDQPCVANICGRRWCIYKVTAKTLSEEAAKFFLHYHCRLTDTPLSIQVIWPPYREMPYIIEHPRNLVIMHVQGQANISTKTFPMTSTITLGHTDTGSVIQVACKERQQLISAGRTNVLEYLYLWKVDSPKVSQSPIISVRDYKGNPVASGETTELPERGLLCIKAPFDGVVRLMAGGRMVEQQPVRANTPLDIIGLKYGYGIDILQGLDVLWSLTFSSPANLTPLADDAVLLQKLRRARGQQLPIDYSWGHFASKLTDMPKTKAWLRHQIRQGYIYKDARDCLVSLFKE